MKLEADTMTDYNYLGTQRTRNEYIGEDNEVRIKVSTFLKKDNLDNPGFP